MGKRNMGHPALGSWKIQTRERENPQRYPVSQKLIQRKSSVSKGALLYLLIIIWWKIPLWELQPASGPSSSGLLLFQKKTENRQKTQSSLFGSCMTLISSENFHELLSAERKQTTNNAHLASEESFWEILNKIHLQRKSAVIGLHALLKLLLIYVLDLLYFFIIFLIRLWK